LIPALNPASHSSLFKSSRTLMIRSESSRFLSSTSSVASTNLRARGPHDATHSGFPPHRSQGCCTFLRPPRRMTSKGQDNAQLPQDEHFVASTDRMPKSFSRVSASPGHTCTQAAFSHWQQRRGKWVSSESERTTRIAELAEAACPVRRREQATSHDPHPVHLSGWTTIVQRPRSGFSSRLPETPDRSAPLPVVSCF
jgi:hypothetical protein